jgi:enterochelin esterase-like enzyme/sugar lactone lactonase YvrE
MSRLRCGILLLAFALGCFPGAATIVAQAPPPAPTPVSSSAVSPLPDPEVPPADVPPGVVKKFTFDQSAIFPGTKRSGAVFIPAQYDGSTPACVYVQQDGYDEKQHPDTVLAELIAAKKMPVTIGIFVSPGALFPPGPGLGARPNRGYEYDDMSDAYVRFLLEELLPYVAKTFDLKLSESGNDRCIVGASSGGIAAFNAAWRRPDAFSRVYASSGSFSAFRYGDEFPTLVRKFEAKPIRVYLTTGTNDMVAAAGDWFLLDQQMDRAFQYSGYEFNYDVVQGGHCAGYGNHLADAMRFLWKDWPAPVKTGASAPRVRDIITGTDAWQPVAQGYQDARSPAANSKGEVFFVDPPANKIYRLGLDGKPQVFLDDAAQADGLAIGPKDELYTVSRATGNVMSYDETGKGALVTGGIPGVYIVVRPDGGLYITAAAEKPGDNSQIWYVKDGNKKLVDSSIKNATGLAYRADQWLLAVADGASKWVYSYEIAADGSLVNKERYYPLLVDPVQDDAGPESICYAQEGQLLVASRSGVQSCALDGPAQVVLPVPDQGRVTGVALGGQDVHTLYAFCGDKIWQRVVKIHGVGASSPIYVQQKRQL